MYPDGLFNMLQFIESGVRDAKLIIEDFTWIKVSDRIPTDDERYLCFDGTIYIANIAWEDDQGCKVWISHDGWQCKPTHWMRLPMPPK